jgi:ATP adenylyltransferase
MDQLWSPWRSNYITSADEQNAEGCFLCRCADSNELSLENLVVARFEHVFVVMNRYPYNAGHLLIAPKEHTGELSTLSKEVAHQLMEITQLSLRVTESVMKPHGCNVGANLGRLAGAGVPDHLHIHTVPRWSGDTNFMPTIAETKMMSNSLEELWAKFCDAFNGQE